MNYFFKQFMFGDGHVEKARIDQCESPQQDNEFDCGLFVLGFAEALTNLECKCIKLLEGGGSTYDSNALNEYFKSINGPELRSQIAKLME
jgi:Ulp1 family protease